MLDRKEIWEELFLKIKGDTEGVLEGTSDFVLQSAILEVMLDNRDLLVGITERLSTISELLTPTQYLGP